ncbi:MAG TPA: GNAT family N-acetyltransferase, partial [Anaerolineae bacterium]|nr:GNAT family N-acetyltransferase [Anaerolineae bacterium]
HVSRLICLIDPENRASIRVARKIGMEFEREHEDKYGRCLVYATFKMVNHPDVSEGRGNAAQEAA